MSEKSVSPLQNTGGRPQGYLPGAVAVVTGASSGIGRAIAISLATEGAVVCLVGQHEGRLSEAVAVARASGARKAFGVRADLTNESDLERLVAQIEEQFGGADILVHCAGIYARAPMETASLADLDAQYAANLRAPYHLSQRMLTSLRRRKGDIVFINSTQGLSATAGAGQFAATQQAVNAVADSLRDELADSGVRVAVLHVGSTATPRQERIFAQTGRKYVPERLLQPEDVASTVLAVLRLPGSSAVTKLTIRPMQKP
jgi:NAD(P)-dependent dehydrogenase (short-subunit alcohol dehydrogenase family)